MQDKEVYALVVKNNADELCGMIKMHDLLQANVV